MFRFRQKKSCSKKPGANAAPLYFFHPLCCRILHLIVDFSPLPRNTYLPKSTLMIAVPPSTYTCIRVHADCGVEMFFFLLCTTLHSILSSPDFSFVCHFHPRQSFPQGHLSTCTLVLFFALPRSYLDIGHQLFFLLFPLFYQVENLRRRGGKNNSLHPTYSITCWHSLPRSSTCIPSIKMASTSASPLLYFSLYISYRYGVVKTKGGHRRGLSDKRRPEKEL